MREKEYWKQDRNIYKSPENKVIERKLNIKVMHEKGMEPGTKNVEILKRKQKMM